MEGFQRVATVSEVPPGQSKVVTVNDRAIALFNIDGTFYAVHNLCPHEGGPLNEGRLKGFVVACPWHDLARSTYATGRELTAVGIVTGVMRFARNAPRSMSVLGGKPSERAVSEKVSGTADFQPAEMTLFPVPRVIIRNASLTIPDKVSGTIGTFTVYPEMLPLFRGDVRFSKIKIDGPSFTIRIPAKKDEKTKSLEEIAALLRSLALGSADISLSVDNGNIKLEKSGRPSVSVKEIGLSLKLSNTKDSVELTIDSLSSKDPGLSLSAVFRVRPSAGMISLEAEGKKMDISPVKKAALDLAGDVPVVKSIFSYLRGGNVEQIAFQSKGNSLEELGGTVNIKIKGSLTKGDVFVPGPKLLFREVEGDCDIANGILKASEITGFIGQSRVKDGDLSVGLKGADALFHLVAAVSADLTDVSVILRNVVKDTDFLAELGHLRSINGKAEGRLVLGENLARIIPGVEIIGPGLHRLV